MSRIQQKQNEKKEYLYYLPDNEDGVELKTDINSLIFIGGNGAGKSRLGAWIEEKMGEKCHRIAGQRNLNFDSALIIKPLLDARARLEYMYDHEYFQRHPHLDKKMLRWSDNKKVTTLLNDFDSALSALIALENSERDKAMSNAKQVRGEECVKIIHDYVGPIKDLQKIWAEVLPQRHIIIKDNRFDCCPKDSEEEKYSATEMSDGERSVLYLIAQALSVSEDKTIIIDEPELHLHPSIMHKLWTTLEEYRKDCLFIYITHDVGFTALHSQSKKYWVKSFEMKKDEQGKTKEFWDYEEIKNQNDFPEELLIEILGGRKNVLFVEGEKQSYDTRLYQALYPEFLVIPCGGCPKVIERTKALNEIEIFNQNYKAYGIIDRDFRTEPELEYLEKKRIYSLNVAEVENLFLLEDVVRWMLNRYQDVQDPDKLLEKWKKYVLEKKYNNQKQTQKQKAFKAEIQHQLSIIAIDEKNLDLDTLKQAVEGIKLEGIRKNIEKKFDTDDYAEILKVFNEKALLSNVEKELKIDLYPTKVIKNLQKNQDLRGIFQKNMPQLHQSS